MTTTVLLPATPEGVAEAARLLRAGHPVGMPTETVYGLAAPCFDEAALARVFEAKERPTFDPLIVHVDAPGAPALDALAAAGLVRPDALEAPARARVEALAAAFWPGPLTLVLPKDPRVPDLATAGLATVGVRAPRHPVARALLRAAGTPLAAPSANRFGRISPTTAADVLAELGGRVAAVLDGGPAEVGLESTVVAVAPDGAVTLLRPGGVPAEEVARVAGVAPARAAPPRPGQGLAAPGALESHYAPARPLALLPAPVAALTAAQADALLAPAAGARAVGLLAFADPGAGERLAALVGRPVVARTLTATGDLAEAARGLFAALRALDAAEVDLLLAEPCPVEAGLGHAIADRLRRAAAPRPGA
ncbi:MAG: L-threonylcarbamoyladenylate synthase [Planctomycetes bacterium]|nr:L-threonylcarbamoyladenylate synthase [Planctomycetota bacterium]